jgi:hypothetical protein
MLRCNVHFNQLPRWSGCCVLTSVSNIFKMLQVLCCYVVHPFPVTSLDATLQHPLQVTSKTLWMLGCNIRFKQLRKRIWILRCNIHLKWLQRLSWCYVVTSVSSNFQDTLSPRAGWLTGVLRSVGHPGPCLNPVWTLAGWLTGVVRPVGHPVPS